MAITKAERDELRRIVKGRFELLTSQMMQREVQIRNEIQKLVEAEHREAIKKMKKREEPFWKKIDAIYAEAREIVKEGVALGLTPRYGVVDYNQISAGNRVTQWLIAHEGKKVNEAIAELKEKTGAAGINLRFEELKLLERIAVASLETEEAQELFSLIPDVDKLLPLPSTAKLKELM